MLESYAFSFLYLIEGFVLLVFAKFLYLKLYRKVDLNEELFNKNNTAIAVSVCGYLLAICIALGGAISGPEAGILSDMVQIGIYGGVTIVVMLLAGLLCEKVLLPGFDNTKEIVVDRNLGTASVEFGVHIANALVLLSIIQSQGTWQSALIFWLLAQIVFIAASKIYEVLTPYSIHDEIERDNTAVGIALAGVFIGIGNIVSISVNGDFVGWKEDLLTFGTNILFGFIVLFVVKKLTVFMLAAGNSLHKQQVGEKPNVGAGLLEALGYVGGSLLVVWAL
tara:strand:- start:51 stop:887 length:837 start_codon:yes stop_codon:yes gene_type:complete